jgi:ParB family transcriptional regulator, chromosome partitioning protein
MTAQIKNRGLGRGLGALLQDSDTVNNTAEKELNALSPNSMSEIPLAFIETNPYQPRTHFDQKALAELSESIKVQGIIQPITVRQLKGDSFQLISGERRLQASKLAGLTTIPAYIRTADDQQMLEMALIENIQRENLNSIEIALSYQRLLTECNLKQDELGERVGKNRSTVNNYLRLLKLPDQIQIGLRDEHISMGHARALISIEDTDLQLFIYRKAVAEAWSVRRVEQAVKEINEPTEITPKPEKAELSSFLGLSDKLTKMFGSKVVISANGQGKGEIRMPFASETELTKILNLLKVGDNFSV